MTKKVLVAGCRGYTDYQEAKEFIDDVLTESLKEHDIIILSGGCRGADSLGERYADENGLPIEIHPADWRRYGRAAGPKRNKEMADACDVVICFWDGETKGTGGLISYAKKIKRPIFLKHIKSADEH